jgi:hypothetical protein
MTEETQAGGKEKKPARKDVIKAAVDRILVIIEAQKTPGTKTGETIDRITGSIKAEFGTEGLSETKRALTKGQKDKLKKGQPVEVKPLEVTPAVSDIRRIRMEVVAYYQIQDLRKQANQHIDAYVRAGVLSEKDAEIQREFINVRLHSLEREMFARIQSRVVEHPLWDFWLSKIRGIGPTLAGALLSRLSLKDKTGKDISHESCWFRYVGLDVNDDGLAFKKEKGVKFHHVPFLKKTLYLAGTSFVRVQWGVYNDIYYDYRAKYEKQPCPKEARGMHHEIEGKNGEKTIIPCAETRHRHMMALRATEKIFLSHMLRVWRKLEGKPDVLPYVFTDHVNPRTGKAFAAHDIGHAYPIPWDGDKNMPRPAVLRKPPKEAEEDADEVGAV